MMHRQTYQFAPAPFFLALLGLAFCGWNLGGGETLFCISSGCQLFQNFTIAGFSLWWAGLVGFGLLALTALAGHPHLGKFFAGIGLFIDAVLLSILLISAPCFPCLIAALLLALCYISFRSAAKPHRQTGKKNHFSVLLLLWSCLFIANLGCLVRDKLDPWPMLTGDPVAASVTSVYISPSCSYCRQLVRDISPEQAKMISWFPVAEDGDDVRIIAAMIERLNNGESVTTALAAAMENPAPDGLEMIRPNMLMLQLRLWRNHARVMSRGGYMPMVELSGLPAFLVPGTEPIHQQNEATPQDTGPASGTVQGTGLSTPQTDAAAALSSDSLIIGQCGPESSSDDGPCE